MPKNKIYTEKRRRDLHINMPEKNIFTVDSEDAKELLLQLGINAENNLEQYMIVLGLAQEKFQKLLAVNAKSSIPVLGGQQPTDADMLATLEPMRNLAARLDKAYRKLPPGLLWKVHVPLSSNSARPKPKLGVITNALHQALDKECKKYQKKELRGKKPAQRNASVAAVSFILTFQTRMASSATRKDRNNFIHLSLKLLDVPHPDPDEHRGKFESFLSEASILGTP